MEKERRGKEKDTVQKDVQIKEESEVENEDSFGKEGGMKGDVVEAGGKSEGSPEIKREE